MTKKLFSILLVCTLLTTALIAPASANVADNVRFLPTTIKVSNNKIVVEGYFVNMNSDTKIDHIEDFELYVYQKDDLLVKASFSGDIDCEVNSLRMVKHTFTINGSHSLNNGTYTCDDSYYTRWFGRISYVD